MAIVTDGAASARRGFKKRLLRQCRQLLKVVTDGLELDDPGRRVVAQRASGDRLVSFTGPTARHGRKSKRQTFKGFKLHLLGDAVSGLIASVTVTPGNHHHGSAADRLVSRARSVCRDIDRVLADTTPGGANLRDRMQRSALTWVAPPPPVGANPKRKRFAKSQLHVDFDALTATCPGGVTTADTAVSRPAVGGPAARSFRWPADACAAGPLKAQCNQRKRTGHRLERYPNERVQRTAREEWKDPEVRMAYRRRAEGERLINRVTHGGGRRAAAWGIHMAHQQAHAIVTTTNLALLARALAS